MSLYLEVISSVSIFLRILTLLGYIVGLFKLLKLGFNQNVFPLNYTQILLTHFIVRLEVHPVPI